eukprot:scaffold380274_cov17-Prasinocladus_malaysianus.AAC.1
MYALRIRQKGEDSVNIRYSRTVFDQSPCREAQASVRVTSTSTRTTVTARMRCSSVQPSRGTRTSTQLRSD